MKQNAMKNQQSTNKGCKSNKKRLYIFVAILELFVFFAGYGVGYLNSGDAIPNTNNTQVAENTKQDDGSSQTVDDDENNNADDEKTLGIDETTVEKMMNDMTLSDMVYQMMFVTPESITKVGTAVQAGEATKKAIEKYPVGGIVYFAANFENRDQTISMIKNTQSFSKIPLFISVDEEGGVVSRLGSNPNMGVEKRPAMKTIGETKDYKKAYEIGEGLANDLKQLGFNVDFAPDADVLINENNTEIGDRSFGSDPKLVAEMVKNVVEGMQKNGVSSTVKHFPGHGSTYSNSHTGYSESKRTIEELRESEFLPFKSAIDANVDFIMISHMTLVNATTEKVPCSLSKEVITDWLKSELGYKGIIITDSFSMGAITEKYSVGDASVKAVKAGADMILMTPDVQAAHDAIMKAVQSGEISEDRIRESVKKILLLKLRKNMFN